MTAECTRDSRVATPGAGTLQPDATSLSARTLQRLVTEHSTQTEESNRFIASAICKPECMMLTSGEACVGTLQYSLSLQAWALRVGSCAHRLARLLQPQEEERSSLGDPPCSQGLLPPPWPERCLACREVALYGSLGASKMNVLCILFSILRGISLF